LTALFELPQTEDKPKGGSVTMTMASYEPPEVIDFGSIADHTFDNPGKGDKGICGNDPMFGEPSCADEFGS
jgi:hypothetical protein